jgi:hypothetical protein
MHSTSITPLRLTPMRQKNISQDELTHVLTRVGWVLKSTINIYQLTSQIYIHLPNGSENFQNTYQSSISKKIEFFEYQGSQFI